MSTEPWEGPLTAKEQAMIDDAWERHKGAAPKINPLIDTSIDALLDLHRIQVEGSVEPAVAARQVKNARAHLMREILRCEFEVRSSRAGDNGGSAPAPQPPEQWLRCEPTNGSVWVCPYCDAAKPCEVRSKGTDIRCAGCKAEFGPALFDVRVLGIPAPQLDVTAQELDEALHDIVEMARDMPDESRFDLTEGEAVGNAKALLSGLFAEARRLGRLEGLREGAEIAGALPYASAQDAADAINAAASRLEGRQG